jgi:halimadienyl-diphosphate synthase
MTPENLLRHIARLSAEPAVTSISPSVYDTAAVAVLRKSPDDPTLLFPTAASWLLANQHPDGSWGGCVPAPHDRVVSTLAAVVALAKLSKWAPAGFPDVTERITLGVERLWQLGGELRPGDPRETIGFEFVLPSLLSQARTLGVNLPYEDFGWVEGLYQRKMSGIPAEAFDRVTTLVHSLETFGDRWPDSALPGLRAPDGCYGCSPAATAAVHAMWPTPATFAYLQTALQATGEGAAPVVFPFRTFDDAWTFHAFAMAGVAPELLRPHVARLASNGVDRGFGPSAGLPQDADDTGTVLPVLAYCGYPVNLGTLRDFETPDGYLTFEFERGISISTNVHVLGALALDRAGQAEQIGIVLRLLRDNRVDGRYWVDKWHLSPYYPTCHAIPVLDGIDDELCADAVSWVLESQNLDGSWGLYGGSAEETGYALNALMAVSDRYPQVRTAVHRGVRRLTGLWTDAAPKYPPLWIGKVLYSPHRVIEAAVVGALYHYTRMPWADSSSVPLSSSVGSAG